MQLLRRLVGARAEVECTDERCEREREAEQNELQKREVRERIQRMRDEIAVITHDTQNNER